MLRRVAVPLLVATLAVVFGGCVVIKSENTQQLDVVGKVRITTVLCASQQGQAGTQCDNGGNAGQNATSDSASTETQLLVAYRVPVGTAAPASFTSTASVPVAGKVLTFTRSASYGDELDEVLPPANGQEWIGYLSSAFEYAYDAGQSWPDQDVAQQLTVAPEFGLPQGPDGEPFTGPFAYRVIAGWRRSNESGAASTLSTRPVRCTADPTTAGPATDTQCADAPAKATIATNATVVTRDLGVVGGPPVTSSHRTTATVPFSVRFAGTPPAGTTIAVRAATDVPGAAATPSVTSIKPVKDNATDLSVSVPIVGDVPAGSYAVTLTARLPSGEERTRTRRLVVPPAPENLVPPTVAGDPLAGLVLTATPGEWRSFADPSFAYQWQRCDGRGASCADLPGENGPQLVVPDAEFNRRLRVVVSASSPDGTTFAASAPTERVLDRRAPKVDLKLTRTTYTRARFLQGVTVRATPSEPARLTFELRSRTTRARLAARQNLVLVRRTLPGSNVTQTTTLKPPRYLVGKARRFAATLTVTARDASGNTGTKKATLRIRP